MKMMVVLLLFSFIGESPVRKQTTQEFFEWFTYRISMAETRRTHWIKGTVITNDWGCVGENQISPPTSSNMFWRYGIDGCPSDIDDLNTNRWIRNIFIVWLKTNHNLRWWEVANHYNMGVNSKWINTNYVVTVMGNETFFDDKIITARKRNGNGRYLVKFKGE